MSPARGKPERADVRRAIPAEMKAAGIDKFGPPSVLTVRTVPVPRPGPTEVLISVHVAGVGIWDAKIRDGSWAEDGMHLPMTLGTDGAGVIVEMGDRVRRWQIGDRVWGFEMNNSKGGFYAEYAVADTDSVGLLPSSLTMLEGGAGSVTGLTALQGIDDHLAVRKGETVMIFGASGAVGTLAVQFASRHRGGRVIAIASGRKAKALLEKLGAETVIDGRRPNALDLIKEAAPDGLDAVLALAGSPVLTKSLRLVKSGGRIAYPNGVEPEPRKRKGIRVMGYDADVSPAAFAKLGRAVAAIDFDVPIAHAYPLNRAAQAHERIERGHVVGRIVLKIR